MRYWLLGFGLLLATGWYAQPTRLTLDFARAQDPAPRRFEVAAELAGTVVALAVKWSKPATMSAGDSTCPESIRLARCGN